MEVDWAQLNNIMGMADPILLGICLLGNVLQIGIKSERWRFILSLQGHTLNMLNSFLIYMSSIYLGLVTPARLGGCKGDVHVPI